MSNSAMYAREKGSEVDGDALWKGDDQGKMWTTCCIKFLFA